MRKIGTFEFEKEALQFWNYLNEKDIVSSLEEDTDPKNWSIWVADEDFVQKAQEDFDLFLKEPNAKRFEVANPHKKPSLNSHPEEKPKKSKGFQEFDLKKQWSQQDSKPGLVTLVLIILVIGVYLASQSGNNQAIVSPLEFTAEIMVGEIWRLITPIFLHFSFFHIFFNMCWLYDLGNQIENKKGPKFFLTFVIILAVASNLAQFLYSGSNFGGMSGVVYGLFGYVWIKCKLDPADGFRLNQTVAVIMFAFFFLCFFGFFGNIANAAHAGGLIVGIAWGYASAFKWTR